VRAVPDVGRVLDIPGRATVRHGRWSPTGELAGKTVHRLELGVRVDTIMGDGTRQHRVNANRTSVTHAPETELVPGPVSRTATP
jgi:hypothetical protein